MQPSKPRHVLLALLLSACTGKADTILSDSGAPDGSGTDGSSTDGATDSGASDGGSTDGGGSDGDGGGTDSGGTDGGGTDTGGGETTEPAPDSVVRFIAMGDGGEGNDDQYAVAETLAALCETKTDDLGPGCDFVLYLGDNFYDDGVDGVDDDQFLTKFEWPYEVVDLPFYVVLGNHDYGELSLYWWKADYEVEYSDHSEKWIMPDKYYSFTSEHAAFYGLNTNEILLGWSDTEQLAWLDGELSRSTSTWNIAFGHHPYVSNGRHGNAGEYEGYEWLPIANGATVKDFFDVGVCGQIDLYLCGHDHNRQWLEPTCGTEFIVTGAAAKTTDLEGRGSPTFFEDDSVEGFVWIELADDELRGEFWTRDGDLDFERSFVKSR